MNVIITGGASGLGASITEKIATDKMHKVYFTYCKSKASALKITSTYKNTYALKCDFANADDLAMLISKLPEINPDVIINNAMAGFEKKHFHKMNKDLFDQSFKNNIVPTLQLVQSSINLFRKKRFGKIITVLSSAMVGKPPIGWSEYVANKAYLASMSKSWAVENAAFNITSNCVSPAFMETSLNSDLDERFKEDMLAKHPLGKFLTTDEVADIILFLIGSSQHINGTNIIVNSASDVV